MENSKRIKGITFSTFDLLHAGHIAMLREAKSQCDYLICGLQVNPARDRSEKNSPVQTLVERWMQLQAVKYVDEIIPYESEIDVEDILKMLDVDIRIIGQEYKEGKFTGRAICSARGIEIYYNKRDHRFSTSDLRDRVHGIELKKDIGGLE
jgi:glycerol-3-phosphate cytidylyltransferase